MNPHAWLSALSGSFLVFDGPDGSGKSTQIRRFVAAARLADVHVLEVREPGGTAIGERIRDVLLDPEHSEMSLRCEMMLYMASRAQLIEEHIRPALSRGDMVLADRFISSTLAYQGAAGGLPLDEIDAVGRVALGDVVPDITILFDVDEQTAGARLNPLLDRMEAKGVAFHRKVREGFLRQAREEPDRHLVIDASQDEDAVFAQLMIALQQRLTQTAGAARQLPRTAAR
ncbi:MAG: dTMP kinase [Phycisphaerales bacterium]